MGKYDGAGPDAFFWVGTEGNPKIVPTDDKTLILDPKGNYFQYRDAKAPILGKYEGETVTLKMPANMKVGDLKWISVWCRKFSIDFGSLIFPAGLGLAKSEESIPHPLAPVDSNTVAEPEPESEPEPQGSGVGSLVSSCVLLVASLLL